MGISGKADIAPALAELKQKELYVEFPNNPKLEHSGDKKTKRGIILYRKAQTRSV